MYNTCTTHPTVIVKAFMLLLKEVFYRTGILFFVLIPRYVCFGVTYAPRSMELHLCPENPIGVLGCRIF